MADMTQPERPEGVESLVESEAQAPSIPLGEPAMPREEGGFPIRRTIAGGLGALAVTAAGFLGFNKIHSGDDGSERPGVIITDPTLEPATPPPTFTPESTPTPKPTEIPRTLEEQLPYELAENSRITYEGKYIKMHFGVDTLTQSSDTCDQGAFGPTPCVPVQKFYLSSEILGDKFDINLSEEEMVEKFENGVLEGHLLNLKKNSKYADWTLDDLKKRIDDINKGIDVEHPKYIIGGGMKGKETSGGTGAVADASKDFYVHKINKIGFVKLTGGSTFNFRELEDGSLVMEIWDNGGAGITDNGVSLPETIQRNSFVIGNLIANGFGIAAMPTFHDGAFHLYTEETARELVRITMPIRNQFMPVNNDPNLAGIFKVE